MNDPTEYSLLGFRNFGWNKDISPAKYGDKEIEQIYTNDKDNPDPTALPGKNKAPLAIIAGKDYNVFDAQGKKVGSFSTRGVEDLKAMTSLVVKTSGVYVVKAKNGGQAFRITVKK